MATENNNKTLNVPNLRFPEFSEEWERSSLGVVFCKVENGLTYDPNNSEGLPVTRIETISDRSINYKRVGYAKDDGKLSKYKMEPGDILFSHINSLKHIGKTAYYDGEHPLYHGMNLLLLRTTNEESARFLFYQLNTSRFLHRCQVLANQAVNQASINTRELKGITLHKPSIKEQIKIADFISLLDNRIATQIKIIEKLESLIRGLITDVNSGRIAQCESVYLRDLLTERHEKNTNNYEVCSVSVSQGVINQIDYLGRSFAAKEVLHYNVVNCGDIVYTKSPTGEFPYGIVKRSDITKPVAVSPLYGVYRPINDYVGKYLHLYFKSPINAKNYLHKLIQKGAKNTINITNQHFLDNKILIPEKGWLENIVNFAAAIEMKIATENKVLQTLQQQKDYLLSKMFI